MKTRGPTNPLGFVAKESPKEASHLGCPADTEQLTHEVEAGVLPSLGTPLGEADSEADL